MRRLKRAWNLSISHAEKFVGTEINCDDHSSFSEIEAVI